MNTFHLSSQHTHLVWDESLAPALRVAPGDEIVLELLDASGGQVTPGDHDSAIATLDFTRVNPCTGPIWIDDVGVDDAVIVTIEAIDVGPWAWTANIPGFGLLSDDFADARLWISSIRGGIISTPVGVDLAARPMIGTLGVTPRGSEPTPLLVPTSAGGNMDIAQITAGSRVQFSSRVPGALVSLGDTHAVQGDGEVCGTGAETSSKVVLRVTKGTRQGEQNPRFTYDRALATTQWTATTGIGPDLFAASRDATRRAVDLVAARSELDPIDAYLLLSLVGELRISEIVDAPNWVVSMHVPSIYAGR